MYAVGESVKVTNPSLRSYGLVGVVIEYNEYNLPVVRFKRWRGQRNKELYFKPENLCSVSASGEQEVKDMSTLKEQLTKSEVGNMEALKGYTRVAEVEVARGLTYYYAVYSEPVKEGSLVTVTGKAAGQILKVTAVYDAAAFAEMHSLSLTAEVSGVLITTDYEDRVACRKHRAELKKKMDAKIREMDEVEKYRRYAEICPELKELFEEFQNYSYVPVLM